MHDDIIYIYTYPLSTIYAFQCILSFKVVLKKLQYLKKYIQNKTNIDFKCFNFLRYLGFQMRRLDYLNCETLLFSTFGRRNNI